MICKNCIKEYHYCTTCEEDAAKYNGYCSNECWEKSAEYFNIKHKFISFYISLTEKQKHFLIEAINDIDYTYLEEIPKWLDDAYKNY